METIFTLLAGALFALSSFVHGEGDNGGSAVIIRIILNTMGVTLLLI